MKTSEVSQQLHTEDVNHLMQRLHCGRIQTQIYSVLSHIVRPHNHIYSSLQNVEYHTRGASRGCSRQAAESSSRRIRASKAAAHQRDRKSSSLGTPLRRTE